MLRVRVTIEIEHLRNSALLLGQALQELLSEVDAALESIWVVGDNGHVLAGPNCGSIVQQLGRGIADLFHRLVEIMCATAMNDKIVSSASVAKSVASHGVELVHVPIDSNQLEVQLWNGIVIGVIWLLPISPLATINTTFVCVERIAVVALGLCGIGPRATASCRVRIAAVTPETWPDVRATRRGILVAIVVIAQDSKPRYVGELWPINIQPCAPEPASACPVPIEIVAADEYEEQLGVRIAPLAVRHELPHLLCHTPLRFTARAATTRAAAGIGDYQIVIVRFAACVALDASSPRSDMQVIWSCVKMWMVRVNKWRRGRWRR